MGTSERAIAAAYDQVVGDRIARPNRGPAAWTAAGIAVVVHAFVLALVVVGVWLLTLPGGGPGMVIAAVGCAALLSLAVLMRPRLGRLGRDEVVLDRDSAPTLFAVADRVSEGLGARRLWRIVVTADINASFSDIGLRGRPLLRIGYPLWAVLSDAERIAILGHELGHDVNGDSRHGLLVGSSLRSLYELHGALSSENGMEDSVTGAVSRVLMVIAASPVLGLAYLQNRLLTRNGHRAEYYADHLAATIAGGGATRSALAKLTHGETITRTARTARLRRDPDMWAAAREWLAANPAPADEEHSPDSTHPPTGRRIAAIAGRGYSGAKVTMTPRESAAIEEELRPGLPAVHDAFRW
ncbi:M48 family metallopeptidase [Actinokineospora auranticolor]|uniref:Zn-dependent protease with chaperone function n=1 Tax=Actinokineospora auranticolor TaxID=155976 RepID=A0A2S6GF43_9PSEU|nr:M48 family metallopeptidase [Actinokineospora auranticolor]PPK63854.1 Zn-dependent protease with chaperone function [Actinokineospora auranticolor]